MQTLETLNDLIAKQMPVAQALFKRAGVKRAQLVATRASSQTAGDALVARLTAALLPDESFPVLAILRMTWPDMSSGEFAEYLCDHGVIELEVDGTIN